MSETVPPLPLTEQDLINLKIHGICMALCFGLFLPLAALVARYSKRVGSVWWLRIHIFFIFVGFGCLLVGVGFIVNVVGFVGIGSMAVSAHAAVGYFLFFGILLQIALGFSAHRSYDIEGKGESLRDIIHSAIGNIVLAVGALNIFLGILRLNDSLPEHNSKFVRIFLAIIVTLVLCFVLAVAILEITIGRGSRYYYGNIFAVAKNLGGAKKMFAIPNSQRNLAIRRASIDCVPLTSNEMSPTELNATLSDLASAVREKEGNVSPFLYRPTWDAGLKKATPINQIAAVEQHMIREDSSVKSIPADVLTRLRETEAVPLSQSNSFTSFTKQASGIVPENSSGGSRPRGRTFSSRPASSSFSVKRSDSLGVSSAFELADGSKESPPTNFSSPLGRITSKYRSASKQAIE